VTASDITWSRGVDYDLIGSLRGGTETITIKKYFATYNMEHRLTITLSDGKELAPIIPVTDIPEDYRPGGVNYGKVIKATTLNANLTGTIWITEIFQGSSGNDTIDGVNGDDTIDGGAGDDRMIGGVGDNVYYVDSLHDTVVEAGLSGYDTILSFVDGYQLAENVEDLYLMEGVRSGFPIDRRLRSSTFATPDASRIGSAYMKPGGSRPLLPVAEESHDPCRSRRSSPPGRVNRRKMKPEVVKSCWRS